MADRFLVCRQQLVELAIHVESLDDARQFAGTGYRLTRPSKYASRELLADFIVECENGPWWHFGRFGQVVILQPGGDGIHVTSDLSSYYLLDLPAAERVERHYAELTKKDPAFAASALVPDVSLEVADIADSDTGKTP